MAMTACAWLGEGVVRHRRYEGVRHAFTMPLWMVLLDLDRADEAISDDPWWGWRRPGLVRILRRDLFGDPRQSAAAAIRALAVERGCGDVAGPVQVLTMPRQFGLGFNPVSFYLLHRRDGGPAGMIAEITNTPWKERHAYVLPGDGDGWHRWEFRKRFHVSPFQPMEQTYRWRLRIAGGRLAIGMTNLAADGSRAFDADLALRLTPLNGRRLRRTLLLQPLMGMQAILRIHLEALRLWWRDAPTFPHPPLPHPLPRLGTEP